MAVFVHFGIAKICAPSHGSEVRATLVLKENPESEYDSASGFSIRLMLRYDLRRQEGAQVSTLLQCPADMTSS